MIDLSGERFSNAQKNSKLIKSIQSMGPVYFYNERLEPSELFTPFPPYQENSTILFGFHTGFDDKLDPKWDYKLNSSDASPLVFLEKVFNPEDIHEDYYNENSYLRSPEFDSTCRFHHSDFREKYFIFPKHEKDAYEKYVIKRLTELGLVNDPVMELYPFSDKGEKISIPQSIEYLNYLFDYYLENNSFRNPEYKNRRRPKN